MLEALPAVQVPSEQITFTLPAILGGIVVVLSAWGASLTLVFKHAVAASKTSQSVDRLGAELSVTSSQLAGLRRDVDHLSGAVEVLTSTLVADRAREATQEPLGRPHRRD